MTTISDLSAFARIVYSRYTAGTITIEQVTALKTSGKLTEIEFNFITGASA